MKILTTLLLITLTIVVGGQTSPQSSSFQTGSSTQGSPSSQGGSDLQILDFGLAQHVTGPNTSSRLDGSNAPAARPDPRTTPVRTTVAERPERSRDTDFRTSDLRSLENEARPSQVEQVNSPPRPYFEYYVRVKNAGGKLIQGVYWQYEIANLDGQEPYIRQVFCKSKLKPEKVKNLRLYSLSSPRKVIKVSNRENASVMKSDEHVIINRIEFSDGSFWQRPNWRSTILSESAVKKVGGGQCFGF